MRFFIYSFVLFYSSFLFSQTPLWTDRIASNGNNYVFNVQVDPVNGDTYSTGRVKGAGTFGELTSPATPDLFGDRDVFLTKNASDGDLTWVKRFGGLYTDYGMTIEIAEENIYIGGYFTDTMWVDTDTLVSSGGQDVFMIKLTKDGDVVWLKHWGGDSHEIIVESYLDEDENIYCVGHFIDSVHFDGIDLINTISMTYAPHRKPSFLMKMDSSGAVIWAEKQEATKIIQTWDVISKDGAVYIVGNAVGHTYFDGELFSTINTSYFDQFIAKYDEDGNFKWTKMFGYNWHDSFTNIIAGDGNELYACGYSRGPVAYGADSINTSARSAVGIRLDTAGVPNQVFVMPGTGTSTFDGVVYQDDCVFFGGKFTDSIFVEDDTIVSAGGLDGYLVQLDSNFNLIGDYQFGGTSHDEIRCLANGTNGNIAVGGDFKALVDFETASFFAVSNTYDGFVTKLCPDVRINTTVSETSICIGEPVNFTNISKGVSLFNITDLPESSLELYASIDSIGIQFNEPGAYLVNAIVENDCSSDLMEYTILVNDPPSIDLGEDIIVCDTGDVLINAIGVFDSIYWSTTEFDVDEILVSGAGTYIAEVWDADGCSLSDSIVVVLLDLPSVELGEDINVCDTEDEVLLSIEGVYDSIYWSTTEFNVNDVIVGTSGVYSAKVWNENGCDAIDSILVSFIDCTGLDENALEAPKLNGYYKDGLIYLSTPNDLVANYSIHSLDGKLIQKGKMNNSIIPVEVELSNDIYIISIENEAKERRIIKLYLFN